MYQAAILLGDLAYAEQQAAAVRGRRDEIDMIGVRMFAATYRGRFKEAAELAADFQARALALSRPRVAADGMMQLAIDEALVGLADAAKARVDKAEEDGILDDSHADDRMVVAALTKDAAYAREQLARAQEAEQKNAKPKPTPSENERAGLALAKLAEGKPIEAAALLEPVSFQNSKTDLVGVWTAAKMQAGDYAAAEKGWTFMTSKDARPSLSATTPFAYASLARVQVKLGRKEEARKNYQKFLDIFKDADPDLPLLIEVKDEMAKLGS